MCIDEYRHIKSFSQSITNGDWLWTAASPGPEHVHDCLSSFPYIEPMV